MPLVQAAKAARLSCSWQPKLWAYEPGVPGLSSQQRVICRAFSTCYQPAVAAAACWRLVDKGTPLSSLQRLRGLQHSLQPFSSLRLAAQFGHSRPSHFSPLWQPGRPSTSCITLLLGLGNTSKPSPAILAPLCRLGHLPTLVFNVQTVHKPQQKESLTLGNVWARPRTRNTSWPRGCQGPVAVGVTWS